MATTWDGWLNDATAWVSATWSDISNSVGAAFDISADVLGVMTAGLVLIALVPVAAHLAWLVLLLVLGAPVWFVLTLVWH